MQVELNISSHVAPLPSPTNLVVTESLATSISLTWDQPQRSADAVDSYEINYSYTVIECGSERGNFPAVTVPVSDSSLRSYTITNSPTTPVEEDSSYSISLTAVNSVGRSEPSNIMVTTPETGELLRICS